MTGQRGLTLVELLIALAVFSLVSTASVAVLSLALGGQEQLRRATEEITRLERARGLLRADLTQLVQRAVRDRDGQRLPSFAGGEAMAFELGGEFGEEQEEGKLALALTRAGWHNPGAARPRSELQRVEYFLRDGALIRRSRPFLDAAADTPFTEQVLLEDLEAGEFLFKVGGDWQDGFLSGDGEEAPAAVRFRMVHPVYGELVHDFLTGPV